ncbi:MAG: peptidoglycan-binding protein [Methylococcales bacterium]|nr:peptidoglycan-binding protein [Methylococcales bacterium]
MLLKVGSKGDDVKEMQLKLEILPADGIFGSGTARAVKQWQRDNGLKADGVVGEKTLELLYAEPREPIADVGDLKLNVLVGAIPYDVVTQIAICAETFEINTPLRLAHFLAQCSHESANFTATHENLNYSAKGLRRTFKRYFRNNLADSYARQPEKIGARVYANRMGNGNEASKEGYLYRGRGYIQLTGKNNYTAFSEPVEEDIVNNPDLVQSQYPLLSGAWFWNTNLLNKKADKGSGNKNVKSITRTINGGTNGLQDRINKFKKYYRLLTR